MFITLWFKIQVQGFPGSVVIRLPMRETWVRSPIWEDPPCHRAAKPVHHSCWTCALGPGSHSYWAHVPQLPKASCPATREATMGSNYHVPQPLKPRALQQEKLPWAATTEASCPATREATMGSNYWSLVPCNKRSHHGRQLLKPRALQQEKPPWAATTEASCPATREATSGRNLLTTTREKPAQQQRPSMAKSRQINKLNFFLVQSQKWSRIPQYSSAEDLLHPVCKTILVYVRLY